MSTLPVWWANVITVVMFELIAAGCFLIPKGSIIADAPDHEGWRDVRWWAVALISVQLVIYAIFS